MGIIRRLLRYIALEAAATILSIMLIYLWMVLVMQRLGFLYVEVVSLVIPAALVPGYLAVDHAIARAFWRKEPMSYLSSLIVSSVIVFIIAIAILNFLNEEIWISGNFRDVLLLALVFGIPSGLISAWVRRELVWHKEKAT